MSFVIRVVHQGMRRVIMKPEELHRDAFAAPGREGSVEGVLWVVEDSWKPSEA